MQSVPACPRRCLPGGFAQRVDSRSVLDMAEFDVSGGGRLTDRQLSAEHMDDPAISRADLAEALSFIRAVNRRLGGTAAALKCIKRWSVDWPDGQTIRLLDVGTGSADIPLAIAQWAISTGKKVHITAVDRHPGTLELAREYITEQAGVDVAKMITFIEADALKLMDIFEVASFDYAHAGMFLHHLSDIEVMTALRIMDRLTTRGLIWNDLVRGSVEKLSVRLMTLGVLAMIQHDARVSVEAGFTKREAMELARRVGLESPRWNRHLFGRFTLTSAKETGR